MADVTVHLLDRGRVFADMNYVVSGYAMGSSENPAPEHTIGEFVVWNALVDHPAGTILWDTGSHPDAGAGYWPAPLYEAFSHVDADERPLDVALDEVGYDVDDVDAVVMSHLHLDHAGGLHHFAGTDTPVYVHEEELRFAYYSAKTTEGSIAYLASDFDLDLSWEVVHGARHTLLPGFELIHLPGHTPGVIGARIDLPDRTLLVAGDESYVDANYADEVPLGPGLLWSERDWFDSLQTLKEEERRTDGPVDVLYGHDLERFTTLAEHY